MVAQAHGVGTGFGPGMRQAAGTTPVGDRLGIGSNGWVGARPSLRGALGWRDHSARLAATATDKAVPQVRTIGFADLRAAVAAGVDDFLAMPSHVIFIAAIYPIVGLILA